MRPKLTLIDRQKAFCFNKLKHVKILEPQGAASRLTNRDGNYDSDYAGFGCGQRYQSKVFSIIFGILRRRNDAEDISQQVFAKIFTSLKGFDFRSSLLTWVYKITVNECYDYLRKKMVRKLV